MEEEEEHKSPLTKTETKFLIVQDWEGYSCRYENWYSDYLDEWFTGVTCFDPEGKEFFHSGMSEAPMTQESAEEHLKFAKEFVKLRLEKVASQEQKETDKAEDPRAKKLGEALEEFARSK